MAIATESPSQATPPRLNPTAQADAHRQLTRAMHELSVAKATSESDKQKLRDNLTLNAEVMDAKEKELQHLAEQLKQDRIAHAKQLSESEVKYQGTLTQLQQEQEKAQALHEEHDKMERRLGQIKIELEQSQQENHSIKRKRSDVDKREKSLQAANKRLENDLAHLQSVLATLHEKSQAVEANQGEVQDLQKRSPSSQPLTRRHSRALRCSEPATIGWSIVFAKNLASKWT